MVQINQTADLVQQKTLATALLNPAAYGGGVDRVEQLETHISYVFLAGAYAYKIKKAVNLGFLDFSTLAARRFYCHEELRLNRRLAPALYLGVVAITGSPENPVFGGNGPVIEYAVKMQRFPQEQLLDRLLTQGRLTPPHIDQLAETMAGFHAGIGVSTTSDAFGTPEAVQRPALDNFAQIRTVQDPGVDRAPLDLLENWTLREWALLGPVFSERKRAGFVRECHGDCHLGNVAVINDEIRPFDCLEFNDNLRWIDVMNEVAFMFMDLQDRKRPDLARRFLNRYLEITGDYEGLRVLRFYVVYRALVRAKVHCVRANQTDIAADKKADLLRQYREYITLARAHTAPPHGAIIITHGLSGSGKTTLTQSLLELTGALRLRSDVERKRLHDLPALARTGSGMQQGIYTMDASVLTYQRLLDLAKIIVEIGYPVIVDATFLKRSQRTAFRQLAQTLHAPFMILDFVSDDTVLRSRVIDRLQREHDASEADIAVLEYQSRTQEPLQQNELTDVITYNTNAPTSPNRHHTWMPVLERLG